MYPVLATGGNTCPLVYDNICFGLVERWVELYHCFVVLPCCLQQSEETRDLAAHTATQHMAYRVLLPAMELRCQNWYVTQG